MKKLKKLCVLLIVFFMLISNIALATSENTTQTPIEPRGTTSEELVDSDEIEQTPIEPRDSISEEDDLDLISLDDESMPIIEDETEIKVGDFYKISDESVSLTRNVDGNVYIIAKDVEISSNMIYGNIFIIAESVNITSDITGSAYIIAKNIVINDGGMSDAYFIANNVKLNENSYVSRDVKILADSLTIDGSIYGSLYSSVENIEVGNYGYIQSDFYYSGELSYANENQIGNVIKQDKVVIVNDTNQDNGIKDEILSIITKAVTALFIIGIILLVSNKKMNTEITPSSVIKKVLLGILYVVLIPIVSVLCMLTVVGLPVGLIILILYVLMFIVCIPVASISITEVALKNKDTSNVKKWLIATLIYVVIAILQKIPVIGTIVTIILGTYGISLIMKLIFKKTKSNNKNQEEEVIK
jgi:hypothetical protein